MRRNVRVWKALFWIAGALWISALGGARAQNCPQARFNLLPETVCTGVSLPLGNFSSNATSFEWNFCAADLKNPMKAVSLGTWGTPDMNNLYGYAMAQDDATGEWFGFIAARNAGKLFRLAFGANLLNPNPVVSLVTEYTPGTFGATGLKFVREGSENILWVGTQSAGQLNRIRFPQGMSGAAVVETFSGVQTGMSDAGIRDVEAIRLNGKCYVFLSGGGSISVLDCGAAFSDAPVLLTSFDAGAVGGLLQTMDVAATCDTTSLFVASYGSGKIGRIDFFNSDYSIPPIITPLTVADMSLSGTFSIKIIWERGNYYAVAQTLNAETYLLEIGENLRADTLIKRANYGFSSTMSGAISLETVRDKGRLHFFNVHDGGLGRIDLATECAASTPVSTDFNPANVTYSQGGLQYIRLQATDPNGLTSYFYDSVYVQDPQVNSVNFHFNNACVNKTIFFENLSDVIDATTIDWLWTFGDEGTSTEQTPAFTFSQTGTFPVTLQATDGNGCVYTTTQNAVVFASPQADFAYQATCANAPVHFQDLSTGNGDPITFTKWELGNGEILVNPGVNFSHTFDIGGTFHAKLIVITQNGCIDTTEKIIYIPKLSFEMSNACVSDNILFTLDTANYSGATIQSYAWDFGDESGANSPNPLHIYNSIGTYTIKLTIITADGCTDTLVRTQVVGQKPLVDFEVTSALCDGVEAQFSSAGTQSFDYPIIGWKWDFGDGTPPVTAPNPKHTFAAPGSFMVTLTAAVREGCVISFSERVNVAYNPVPDFELPKDYCIDKYFTLIDKSVVQGSLINDWRWEYPGEKGSSAYSTLVSPKIKFDSIGTFTVRLIVESALGCRASVEKTIKIHPGVKASFAATPLSGVRPLTVALLNDPQSGASYQWLYGDASAPDPRPQPLTHIYADSGHYSLKLIASNAYCSDTAEQNIVVSEAIVPLNDVAIVDNILTERKNGWLSVLAFVQNKGNVPVTRLQMIVQTAPDNAFSEEWTVELPVGQTKPYPFNARLLTTPPDSSLDFVCVRAEKPNGAPDRTPEDNEKCRTLRNGLQIYYVGPNPTHNNLTVRYVLPRDGTIFAEVFDRIGRRMTETSFAAKRGDGNLIIEAAGWASGIYTLRLRYEKEEKALRFIKIDE